MYDSSSTWAPLLLALCVANSSLAFAVQSDDKSVQPSLRSPAPLASPVFDASALREGKFTYELRIDEDSIGLATIEIRRGKADVYQIRLASKEIGQTWISSFGQGFRPKAARLEMSGENEQYSAAIEYVTGGASGTQTVKGTTSRFRETFDRLVIDQRVDWAAMMAASIPVAGTVEFHVFDPGTSVSSLLGKSTEVPPMRSVLGLLPTVRLDYTIHKAAHAEVYTVYATKDRPRVMLREEMPGNLVSVLIAVED